MNKVVMQICPPIILHGLKVSKSIVKKYLLKLNHRDKTAGIQDLAVYWDAEMAQLLETWGEGNAWKEIQYLMVGLEGKVLDIACGTGKAMEILSMFPSIEVFGCDISDFLISKARERGIREERLRLCDATNTDYPDNYFDYAYSIGSLEHFTEDGIFRFISECYRITQKFSFHMIPVSARGADEGWITRNQSYYNNSLQWWLNKYKAVYTNVYVLNSTWEDDISAGKWFICMK